MSLESVVQLNIHLFPSLRVHVPLARVRRAHASSIRPFVPDNPTESPVHHNGNPIHLPPTLRSALRYLRLPLSVVSKLVHHRVPLLQVSKLSNIGHPEKVQDNRRINAQQKAVSTQARKWCTGFRVREIETPGS